MVFGGIGQTYKVGESAHKIAAISLIGINTRFNTPVVIHARYKVLWMAGLDTTVVSFVSLLSDDIFLVIIVVDIQMNILVICI